MNNDKNQQADDELVARVDAIGAVAAALMEQMKEQARRHEHLTWTDMVAAAAVACRGAAAIAIADDPELTLDEARVKMTKCFMQVMLLPPELVRIQKTDDDGSEQVIVVPVRKHS